MGETAGPMLLGFDVLWVATILSGVAAFAVMVAIYAATTVSDPMAKRVKALNDRREQLKAGITASTKRRASTGTPSRSPPCGSSGRSRPGGCTWAGRAPAARAW